ncbi:hypothetical protein [Planctomycetes bacterium SV_7m_r]|uniref:hypothetical protein n=1 Tax=Stieleria bergensis TaxID=2528025 RepID=UPI0011AAEFE3
MLLLATPSQGVDRGWLLESWHWSGNAGIGPATLALVRQRWSWSGNAGWFAASNGDSLPAI